MAAILKLVCDSIMSMGLQNLQFATKIQLKITNLQPKIELHLFRWRPFCIFRFWDISLILTVWIRS